MSGAKPYQHSPLLLHCVLIYTQIHRDGFPIIKILYVFHISTTGETYHLNINVNVKQTTHKCHGNSSITNVQRILLFKVFRCLNCSSFTGAGTTKLVRFGREPLADRNPELPQQKWSARFRTTSENARPSSPGRYGTGCYKRASAPTTISPV
jgi:hypothetical protein